MTIRERLNAIADALEIASEQARLLADEVEHGCTVEISGAQIARSMQQLNQRVGTQCSTSGLNRQGD